jgi:hypothetical protein
MIRLSATIATAFLLAGTAACAVPEDEPEDRSYYDVDILQEKVIEAGYKCPSWDEKQDSVGIRGGYAQIKCSNGDYVVWFSDSAEVKSFTEIADTDIMLAGQNWAFVSAKAASYQQALGGELLKP